MITNDTPDSISFEKPFNSSNYSLVQVTKELAEHVRNGKTFIIRGSPDDNLCLCTDSETFRVREVETTDTLFVADVNMIKETGSGDNYKIRAYLQSFLELTKEEMSPYLMLKTLLEARQFDLYDDELNDESELITMDDVLNKIQFSETEIVVALNRLPVVEYQGALRFLKRSFRAQLLNKLVELVDDYTIDDVSIEKVDLSVLKDSLKDEFPEVFINWIYKTYTNHDGSLSCFQISKDRAIELLIREHSIGITAFERHMKRLLPVDMEFDKTSLKGVALVKNTIVRGQIVDYVNVDDLPTNPKDRLDLLFKLRTSWLPEDIEPYVVDFCTSEAGVGTFLMKNCQSVKEDNVKVFVRKNTDF